MSNLQESSVRVREMQILATVIKMSEEMRIGHTSMRRLGKYLINLANNEHATQVRNGAKTEINDRIESLHKIAKNNGISATERIEQFKLELELIRAAHARWTEAVKTV